MAGDGVMPRRKQPRSLAALTQAALAAQLVSLCRTLQSIAQETTPAYALAVAQSRLRLYWLSSLPGCIRARLLQEGAQILATPVPDTGAMGAGPVPLYLLTLLLAPDIHDLRVELCCYYGCTHQAALLRLLASQGNGLESLQLARSALLRLGKPPYEVSTLLLFILLVFCSLLCTGCKAFGATCHN